MGCPCGCAGASPEFPENQSTSLGGSGLPEVEIGGQTWLADVIAHKGLSENKRRRGNLRSRERELVSRRKLTDLPASGTEW
jgi:hypothetical protein